MSVTAAPSRVIGSDSRGRTVATRPVVDTDREFLRAVYASTRQEELAPTGWSPATVDAFLAQQFEAQDRHYRTHYPGAELSVIAIGGVDAGRVYADRLPGRLLLIEIALLPQYRGCGAGSLVIQALLDEADSAGLEVRLHVEMWNPARRLYERLGFEVSGTEGPYIRMDRQPRVRSRVS